MKIGDKVRFLSSLGGGTVAGFQGKDIVLVEDEDGFQIPTRINDVVPIQSDDYSSKATVTAKMRQQEEKQQDLSLNAAAYFLFRHTYLAHDFKAALIFKAFGNLFVVDDEHGSQ